MQARDSLLMRDYLRVVQPCLCLVIRALVSRTPSNVMSPQVGKAIRRIPNNQRLPRHQILVDRASPWGPKRDAVIRPEWELQACVRHGTCMRREQLVNGGPGYCCISPPTSAQRTPSPFRCKTCSFQRPCWRSICKVRYSWNSQHQAARLHAMSTFIFFPDESTSVRLNISIHNPLMLRRARGNTTRDTTAVSIRWG